MKGLIVMTATAAALALAIPAYASAEVLCVDLTGGDCTQTSYAGADGFQQALTDANNNGSYPGPDTVRLGPEAYTAPLNTGFIYSGGAARVSIIGSGEGQTTIEMQTPPPPPDFTSFVGLLVGGVVGSSVSDLTVRMPAPADAANTKQHYRGLWMRGGAAVTDVTIEDSGQQLNGFAMHIDSGTVTGMTIDVHNSGSPTITGISPANTVAEPLTVQDHLWSPSPSRLLFPTALTPIEFVPAPTIVT